MRVSLDWLAEWVPLPEADALVERLSLAGFDDVEIEGSDPALAQVRVARVARCEPHPDADKLSVCGVDLGDGESRTIVCGAPNVAAGQKVAVALPGARLPDGTRLKKAKLRGVVSEGMICSRRELALGEEHEGIWVLPEDAVVGVPLPDVPGVCERVLEVGITPNRGDAASLLGLAREVRALFGGELSLPETDPQREVAPPAASAVRVTIEAGEACHHYVARVVRGVRVGPSAEWLRRRLEASGIRAINNVVDATNLVLLEFGQPLHAFDLARVRGAEIRVRRAAAGEKLATLDGQVRVLDPSDLVIADAEGAVALAGVMGGADSEVSDDTRDVLIESAHFHPTCVRLSARRHGLHSEASYRFERGVDRAGVRRAADRAARLIAELAGGEVAGGVAEARGEAPPVTETIRLEVVRANRLLGTQLTSGEIRDLLGRVEIEAVEDPPGLLECRVPSHRNDLHRHQDLSEEVARMFGYDRIPTTLPVATLEPASRPASWDLAERVRDALAGAGLTESISFPFIAPADLDRLRLAADDARRATLGIQNPVHEEASRLRSTLAASLLRAARQNRSRQVDRIRIFEVSRLFRPRGEGELPEEPLALAALLVAGDARGLWQPETPVPLFFDARGIAERLLIQLGYVAWFAPGGGWPYLHPGSQVNVGVGSETVGAIGEIHPEVAANFELDAPAALIELDLSALQEAPLREFQYREVSRHPQVRRDLAVLVPAEQPAGELLEAIPRAAGRDLVDLELYDRYAGRGVPAGRVSLAFRMVFQRADRTLKDAEVARATDRVVEMLAKRFGGELR